MRTLIASIVALGVGPIVLPAPMGRPPVVTQRPPLPATPVDPIGAILEAFRTHPLVALGEAAHLGEQDHAFRLALVRDPRFSAVVNDIVVERGNARYQDVMDRFIRGENVTSDTLKHVWQDTTGLSYEFDAPLTEEFFRTVRTVNATLPEARRLRVLLGDPPIEWENVRTFADVLRWGDQRDPHAASVIRREVLEKRRRALLVYGSAHFQRRNQRANYETANMLGGLIERDGTRMFTIWPAAGRRITEELGKLQPDVSSWAVPSLVLLRGTVLGAADFETYSPSDTRFTVEGGRPSPVSREQWQLLKMEDQFDALLYLGPVLTYTRLSATQCADARYMELRMSRMLLAPNGQANVERLKQACASARQ